MEDMNQAYKVYCEYVNDILSNKTSSKWDKVISDLVVDNVHIGTNIYPGARVIKARIHHSQNKKPYEESQIGMNKVNPTQNRWNEEGNSLFYLCRKRKVALAEIGAHVNDVVSIGHFIVRDEKQLICVRDSWSTPGQLYGGLPSSQAMYVLSLFIKRQFKAQGDENTYKVTNYMSRLFRKSGIDGILYESVALPAIGNDCIALISDENVEYRYTEQVRVTNDQKWETELIQKAYHK